MDPDDHLDDHNHPAPVRPVSSPREYGKLAVVFVCILLVSVALTYWRGWSTKQLLGDFMAVFFITFAGFKFINLDTFAHTYQTYDLISQLVKPWAYAFPFVEAALGFSYLLTNNNHNLYLVTMLITGLAGWSVWRELRIGARQRRRSHMMCACLGTVIQLPLSKVSFIEDAGMFLMAVVMLVVR